MKKSFVFVTLFLVCGIISADELRNQLALDIQGVMTKVTDWRHHFHEYPELSNREFKTQASIATALTEMGLARISEFLNFLFLNSFLTACNLFIENG